jgi:hypothetical protein
MDALQIKGTVRTWEESKDAPGIMIPGTYKEDFNAISTGMKRLFAYALVTSNNYAMDNLFAVSEVTTDSVTNNNKDGIYYYKQFVAGGSDLDDPSKFSGTSGNGLQAILKTTKNSGGDKEEVFTEFFGELDGPFSYTGGSLGLGYNYQNTATSGNNGGVIGVHYANKPQDITIDAGRKFFVYWKITIL